MKKHSIKVTLFGIVVFMAAFYATCYARSAEKTYTNSIGMEFVLIPAGSFTWTYEMYTDVDREIKLIPICKVTISEPFYLGKYEVTQEQWYAVMGNNPAKFPDRNNPVEQVSWNDAREFIKRLNRKEGRNRYRLPTEAEWEYAARAGSDSAYFFGDDGGALGRYAWYRDNSEWKTHPVGQKAPNPWGLYDIYGNVWEWVQDWFEPYPMGSATDPHGPFSGESRVYRGGSSRSSTRYWFPSSIYRNLGSPDYRSVDLGFRLALSPE